LKYNKNSFILAGDIGGTKTHLALFSKGEKRPKLRALETYPSQQVLDLESIVECFLKSHDVSISSTCFGVAGPVEDGQCKTTNLPWSISEKELKDRFKWDHLCLINDLAATAYAIPSLKKEELFVLHRGKRVKEGNLGLIAPGTGLGMALMIFHNNRYVSVPSEG
jgi:glucokinase